MNTTLLEPDKAMANLHLLALPHVVRENILACLTIPDQLQMRTVCKITKEWIDERGKRLSEHIPNSIIRNRGAVTFSAFCVRGSPHRITSIYLDNDKLDVYEDAVGLREFVFQHSSTITDIHVKRYFISSASGKQTQFFDSFPNLESVEMDEVWLANEDEMTPTVSGTFRRLKTLKFGTVKLYTASSYQLVPPNAYKDIPSERKKNLRWHIWNVLDNCEELKFLRVPISPKNLFENPFDECFRLLNYIRIRTRGITERGFRAQQYVMKCDVNNFTCCMSSMEVLLIVGARMRIQFLNVNSRVFKRGSSFCLVGVPPRARFDYIHSFLSTALVNRPFDHVQKLTFKASLIQNECIIGHDKGPSLFPNLREFIIVVDIGVDEQYPSSLYSRTNHRANQARNVCFPRADQVLKFFFPENQKYLEVRTAAIIFTDPAFPHQKRAQPDRLGTLPTIVQCLPCLTRLTISGWNCKRTTYVKLWHGFQNLQRLCIESCATLTSSCFIDGTGNPNNPTNFQLLPDLEFLELRGLVDMPGIVSANGEYKPSITDVFEKLGLVPFSFLSKPASLRKNAVWIRPTISPRPMIVGNTTMITRSIAKALKAKQAAKRARRF